MTTSPSPFALRPFAGSASIRAATTSPNTEPEPQADLQALAFSPSQNEIAMPSFIMRMLTIAYVVMVVAATDNCFLASRCIHCGNGSASKLQ